MLDLIASVLIKGLNIFFSITPIRFNLWLGRRFGTLVYLFSGKRKMVAYANMKAAFSKEKQPAELKKIVKRVYVNMVQSFAEIVSMTKINKKYVDKYITIHNIERIEELSKKPNGVIFISAHFGNWEFNAVVSGIKGFPIYFLGREQKMKRVYELINSFRESTGNVVIRKGTDVKTMIRVLHKGKIVGMAGDQNAGVNGELLDVFGRPASTAIGPFRIAERTGAYILPAFIRRIKGPYHDLVIEEPMTIGKGEDIVPCMNKFNRLLEKHVSEHPDQWLWMHKRWKMTPVRKLLILDDGKKGHLKQSLAVAEEIKRYREGEGVAPEHTEVMVREVKFRSRSRRTVFSAMSPFFTNRQQGRLKMLKWALESESYETLIKLYADVVISCGSALFGVNRLMKIENYARNVTVLDPGFLMRKKFNLVIVPRHDAGTKEPDKGSNLIVTDLAPNLVRPEDLGKFTEGTPREGKVRIGLLLGGDNRFFTFSESFTGTLTEQIKKTLEEEDGYLYCTTSRRTGEGTERITEDAFKGYSRCSMYVSGKLDKDEYTVEKILAASDILIVSGESISMVSEAVSSGKAVLVFMPDKRKRKMTKYERFVNSLEKRDVLKCVKPEEITEEVKAITSGKMKFILPEDKRKIKEKLYRLF